MPYIKQEIREYIKAGEEYGNFGVGELNYTLTALVHKYLQHKGLKYATINEAIGALECAKLELYRMVAAPYENQKHKENGPVSELDKDV